MRKVISEMGYLQPPLKIDDVIAHLSIDRSYYDLEKPGLLREIFHRIKVGGHQLKDLIRTAKLQGLWLPQGNKILIDSSVAELKRKWVLQSSSPKSPGRSRANANHLKNGSQNAARRFFAPGLSPSASQNASLRSTTQEGSGRARSFRRRKWKRIKS